MNCELSLCRERGRRWPRLWGLRVWPYAQLRNHDQLQRGDGFNPPAADVCCIVEVVSSSLALGAKAIVALSAAAVPKACLRHCALCCCSCTQLSAAHAAMLWLSLVLLESRALAQEPHGGRQYTGVLPLTSQHSNQHSVTFPQALRILKDTVVSRQY